MNAPTTHTAEATTNALPRTIGLHGRVAVLSAMAGGVALGGVLVAAMTLGGQLSGHALFMNSTALFVVGAALGLLHGAPLGFFGRPEGVTARRAAGQLALAALYGIPGLAVAWLASVWVAMSVVAAYTGSFGALAGVAVGWVGCAAILSVAFVQSWRAAKNAYARWPQRRTGTLLVAASFAALLVTFLADRPEIWGLRLRVTETGAVLLSAVLAVWVVGPMVTVSLRLLKHFPSGRAATGLVEGRWTATDLAVGLLVGGVVGLLAVPFAGPLTSPALGGILVAETSQALLNEVLLRLFVVSGVAWLLLRWHRVHPEEAAVGAIITATVVQVALYTPGALRIGFASGVGTAAFLLAGVAIPALAFGLLFWKRGFASALVADATALIALALLV
jgi:hypothetical protein